MGEMRKISEMREICEKSEIFREVRNIFCDMREIGGGIFCEVFCEVHCEKSSVRFSVIVSLFFYDFL